MYVISYSVYMKKMATWYFIELVETAKKKKFLSNSVLKLRNTNNAVASRGFKANFTYPWKIAWDWFANDKTTTSRGSPPFLGTQDSCGTTDCA